MTQGFPARIASTVADFVVVLDHELAVEIRHCLEAGRKLVLILHLRPMGSLHALLDHEFMELRIRGKMAKASTDGKESNLRCEMSSINDRRSQPLFHGV